MAVVQSEVDDEGNEIKKWKNIKMRSCPESNGLNGGLYLII